MNTHLHKIPTNKYRGSSLTSEEYSELSPISFSPALPSSNESSAGLLRRGALTLKKKLLSSRKNLILCSPTTLSEISLLFNLINDEEQCFTLSASASSSSLNTINLQDSKERSQKSITLLGELTLSAIKITPLLIIDQSQRIFIPFSSVISLYDEIDQQVACHFTLITDMGGFRFASDTSVDYQEWIRVIKFAFKVSRKDIIVTEPFTSSISSLKSIENLERTNIRGVGSMNDLNFDVEKNQKNKNDVCQISSPKIELDFEKRGQPLRRSRPSIHGLQFLSESSLLAIDENLPPIPPPRISIQMKRTSTHEMDKMSDKIGQLRMMNSTSDTEFKSFGQKQSFQSSQLSNFKNETPEY